jgi:tRNA (adenine22-N1)-methyltransferase
MVGDIENVNLSPRLQAVADMIPHCDTVVDVGSDHGYLGAYCLSKGACRSVIATDIHKEPAMRTLERLKEFGDCCEVKVTDGLNGVDLKTDMSVAIAGMGGLEICKILNNALSTENSIPRGMKFILQPQKSQYEVRAFLSEAGFAILDEKIVIEKDRFLYTILLVEYTGEPYGLTDEEKFLGPIVLKQRPENYDEYIAHEKEVFEKKALGDPKCAEILKNWEKYL